MNPECSFCLHPYPSGHLPNTIPATNSQPKSASTHITYFSLAFFIDGQALRETSLRKSSPYLPSSAVVRVRSCRGVALAPLDFDLFEGCATSVRLCQDFPKL